MSKQRTPEEMREYQRQRRERMRVTPSPDTPVTPKDVTPKHVCMHVSRPVPEGTRVLTCSRQFGPPISWQVELPEPQIVTCPCCGKEWLCKRPDVQSPYCLKCDTATPENWRDAHPYKRPHMADTAEILAFLAKRKG